MKTLSKLAWKLLLASSRSSSLWFYGLSIVLAAAAMTSVSIFSERVTLSLKQQAINAVGGDLQISSHEPLPQSIIEQTVARGLRTTQQTETPTVLYANDHLQMARLKVIDDQYPLQGQLLLQKSAGRQEKVANGPKAGELWLDSRLLASLELTVGEMLDIGEHSFIVTEELLSMPDNGVDPFALSPVALINSQDLKLTQLIQPGSRASYRLMVLGEGSPDFLEAIREELSDSVRVIQPGSEEGRVFRITEQALTFLRLGALSALLMAAVVIALTTHLLIKSEAKTTAVLRTLGLKLREIILVYSVMFFVVASASSLCGVAFGQAVQWLLVTLLAQVSPIDLPAAGFIPYSYGVVTAWLLVFGVTLPALWRCQGVTPSFLLSAHRAQLPWQTGQAFITLFLGLATAFLLMWLLTQNLALSNQLLLGLAGLVVGVGVFVTIVIKLLAQTKRILPFKLRLLVSQASRGLIEAVPQLVAATVAIGLFLLLTQAGGNLLQQWQAQIPVGTPNYFAYNINPDQAGEVDAFLHSNGVSQSALYPMVRGRVEAINERSVTELYAGRERPNSLRRALNITWTDSLAKGNTVIEGQWFGEDEWGKPVISIEQGMAERLGVGLGDSMTFRFAESSLQAKVVSIRKLEWASFTPNFFVIFPPGILENYPSTGIVSFHLSESQKQLAIAFNRAFPTVTLLDIDEILSRVQAVVLQMSNAISLLQVLTFITTVLVVILIVLSGIKARRYEVAILKTLGLSEYELLQQWLTEMTLLGVISGCLAAGFALMLEYSLSEKVLGVQYHLSTSLIVLALALSLLLHWIVAVWGGRRVVKSAAMDLLRDI